jgi:uncharacterized protein
MMYKPSKFNFIHTCENGELRLYNSWKGTGSLSIIPPEHSEDVLTLLKTGAVSGNGECDSFLIAHGFLVPEERNEDRHRAQRVMELTTGSTMDLILLPTEQCNFRCKYCYETFEKGKMSLAVQESIIKHVRKNLHRFTGLNISWFGGEPLVALDVIANLSEEFIKICKAARKPYHAGMTTNGYNLSTDTYNKLYSSYKINNYQITLDGLEEEHDNQRVLADGSGTYKRIVANLLAIRRHTRGLDVSFTIRTNYTKKILADMEQYLRFYSKNFGDDPRFNIYMHMASDWGGERVHDFADEMMGYDKYQDILNNVKRFDLSLNRPLNLGLHHSNLDCGSSFCYAGKKNSIVIGSDGLLYKCTADFIYEKNIVGRIDERGELLLNENYSLWLAPHETPKKCETCFYGACCLSMSCPALGVRGMESDICSFEKANMGLFLELFDRQLFAVL